MTEQHVGVMVGKEYYPATLVDDELYNNLEDGKVAIRWDVRGDVAIVDRDTVVYELPRRKRHPPIRELYSTTKKQRSNLRITVPADPGSSAPRQRARKSATVTPTKAPEEEEEDQSSVEEKEVANPGFMQSNSTLVDDSESEEDLELFPDDPEDEEKSQEAAGLLHDSDSASEEDLELFPQENETEEQQDLPNDRATVPDAQEVNKSFPPALPTRLLVRKLPDDRVRSEGRLIIYKESNDEFFLRWHFGEQLKVREVHNLSSEGGTIEKQCKLGGEDCTLVCAKLEKGNNKKTQPYGNTYLKAFYVSMSKTDIRKELEKIADFGSLSGAKAASRFELLVSPAASSTSKHKFPYHFELGAHEFEVIPEMGNEGSGFIPEDYMDKLLGRGKVAALTTAIQVRIVAPRLGIYKGTLVRKLGIERVQLPPSMHKVKASQRKRSKRWAYFEIIRTFPSVANDLLGKSLNPNRKPSTGNPAKSLKQPPLTILQILSARGVPDDTLNAYCCSSTESWALHKHAWCVGVADPTGSLPPGTVFISGRGQARDREFVFIARSPCTEAEDSLVVENIRRKPNSMTKKNWDFLCSFHFGTVVFSRVLPGEESLPEKLGGDLDGDPYFVCWDEELIYKINSTPLVAENSDATGSDDSDDIIGSEFSTTVDGKMRRGAVTKKNGDSYIVNFGKGFEKEYTRDDIMKDREYVERIEDHRGVGPKISILVCWSGGAKTWKQLSEHKNEIPDVLADYAVDNDLLETDGWKWAKKLRGARGIREVVDHRGKGRKLEVEVLREDGSTLWEIVQCKDGGMKEDHPDVLAEYAKVNDLLEEKDWRWVKKHLDKTKNKWFERAQDVVANVSRKKELSRLTEKLNSAYKSIPEFMDDDKIALGRAFKDSIDIEKHGGRVELPGHLRNRIPMTYYKYILFDDE